MKARSILACFRRQTKPPIIQSFFSPHIGSYGGSPPLEDSLYSEFARRLEDDASDTVVFQILVEEWTFLQSQSWIASRIRRPFSAFLRAGAVAIELGGKTLDEVVVRTLKIPQQKCPLP